ncbi:MAG: Sir2 family NAD-dependent protein deacetylase [Dehalococcoidales bacterium]|nr:Sir2 family NAD-dependent protein deacetylase [Dehalococcoidales bacterium]
MDREQWQAQADQIAEMIHRSRKLVIFTGAGISTESGIPDFRSPGGVWTRYNPEDFTYQKYVGSTESRRLHWQMLREGNLHTGAEPNAAHYAIAELERLGKLDCVITQNVDNLHQKAGVPGNKVFELHGNMQRVKCLGCGRYYPFAEINARVDAGEPDPGCAYCSGVLKPDAVFFGEMLPSAVLEEASGRSAACDMFIVIGSSLVVYPAAYMPVYADNAGAELVIINLSETPLDRRAAVVIHAGAGGTMKEVIARLKSRL